MLFNKKCPISGLLMYGGKMMLHFLFKHIHEITLHVCICICDILHLYVVFLFPFIISIKEVAFYMNRIVRPVQFEDIFDQLAAKIQDDGLLATTDYACVKNTDIQREMRG